MKLIKSDLEGLVIIAPTIFNDNRGWFMETYSEELLKKQGIKHNFIQDNHSFSVSKGTLRGLHYQTNPKAQAKLIRCTKGSIYDVAVDIRKGSPTFGKWFGIELNAENKKQLLIPKGFAHGFITLTDNTEVQYKVDEVYSPQNDRGILWNDPDIKIEWPNKVKPILSEKDEKAPVFEEAENNFTYEKYK